MLSFFYGYPTPIEVPMQHAPSVLRGFFQSGNPRLENKIEVHVFRYCNDIKIVEFKITIDGDQIKTIFETCKIKPNRYAVAKKVLIKFRKYKLKNLLDRRKIWDFKKYHKYPVKLQL